MIARQALWREQQHLTQLARVAQSPVVFADQPAVNPHLKAAKEPRVDRVLVNGSRVVQRICIIDPMHLQLANRHDGHRKDNTKTL
jgi:hypothetical protein